MAIQLGTFIRKCRVVLKLHNRKQPTRGCLCELAKKIGFDHKTETCYDFTNQVQSFRQIYGSDAGTTTKFIRNLHLAHLKFPFPHMVSVTMKEKTAIPGNHLICQGKVKLVV